jgi:hypothetical protein
MSNVTSRNLFIVLELHELISPVTRDEQQYIRVFIGVESFGQGSVAVVSSCE